MAALAAELRGIAEKLLTGGPIPELPEADGLLAVGDRHGADEPEGEDLPF
jgi:hypothetical protein